MIKSDIKDIKLAGQGKLKIDWAANNMPVLNLIRSRLSKKLPLKGVTLGACLHVTSETANLAITLKELGARVFLCASNPLSTQDEIAASLVKDYQIAVYAIKGENTKTYYQHLEAVLDNHPQITMDDGADLVSLLHSRRNNQLKEIIGSSEETTTGVIRLKAMEKDKALKIPVVAVNDSKTKHFFDNHYGTGQSTIDAIMRATNILLAGKTFVVAGYGYCGKGLARRAKGMGSSVIICEIDPVRALEAHMDGFRVMPMAKAAVIGDIFVTVTGDKEVINIQHIEKMKNGAIIANSGHFNVEIDIDKLDKKYSKHQIKPSVEEYKINKKKIYVLAQGRLVNLAAAEGHPAEVMDMSFANQVQACLWLLQNKGKLESRVYRLPDSIDNTIARLKLEAMGIQIDKLTPTQKHYLSSWKEGT